MSRLQVGELIEFIEGDPGVFEVVRVTESSAAIRTTRLITKSYEVKYKTVVVEGRKRKVPLEVPKTITREQQSSEVLHISANSHVKHVGWKQLDKTNGKH